MSDAKATTLVVALIGALIAGIVWLVMFAAGWGSVPVDSVGLHYSGGPIQGQKFVEVIEPGSGARFLGLLDDLKKLPVTQRDYTFCDTPEGQDPKCDAGAIIAPARGGAKMKFEGGVTFSLDTSDERVRPFYERICVKFDCTSDDGWDEMLRVNFRGPIEQAIQQSVRGFTVDEVYAGVPGEGSNVDEEDATTILEQVQTEIARDLKENINAFTGGRYFCGPNFDRTKPDECSDFQFQITLAVPTQKPVIDAFAENAASQQAKVTAQNNADADVAEAEGQRRAQEALAGLYTDPSYIAYLNALALGECAKNSNCTLVVGSNGGVNITPREPAG